MEKIPVLITRIDIDAGAERKDYLVQAKQGDKATRFVSVLIVEGGKEYAPPADADLIANFQKPDGKFAYNAAKIDEGNRILVELTNQVLAAPGEVVCEVEIRAKDSSQVLTSCMFTVKVGRNNRDENAILSSNEMTAFDTKWAEINANMEEWTTVERLRVEAEQKRAEAETARVNAETARVNAETARVTAENKRKTDTQAAIERAKNAAKEAEGALKNQAELEKTLEDCKQLKESAENSAADAAASKTAAKASKSAAADSEKNANASKKAAEEAAALAQQISQGAKGFYPTYKALNEAHPTGKDGDWAIVGTTDTIWTWDSNTENWFDSGNAAKFANYYDKTQIDAKLPKPVTVTVAASAWTTGDYSVKWDDGGTSSYTACATVTAAGVTADSRIVVSDRTRVTDAVRMVAALEPGAGVVKFYTNAAPTSAAVFILEVSA